MFMVRARASCRAGGTMLPPLKIDILLFVLQRMRLVEIFNVGKHLQIVIVYLCCSWNTCFGRGKNARFFIEV